MPITGWKEKLFQHYLMLIYRPSRLEKHLKDKLPRRRQLPPVNRKQIRVAALQLKLQLCSTPFDYVDEMHRRVKEAADEGAQLLAFPEYNNLPLLGVLPGVEEMGSSEQVDQKNAGKPDSAEISLTDVFRYMSPIVCSVARTVFSTLSRAYRLYIMSGSYVVLDNGSLVNRAFLYGPDGTTIGNQDKVHLMPQEAEWHIKRGQTFSVFETDLGNLAMPVCMDATYYETFRILEHLGTEIVLLPIANLEKYNYWLALRGIWPRVQESQLYGIKSALVGSLAGFTFTGRSGIFAPLELTPRQDGVLAEVESYDREAMAIANLDLEALAELRCNHPWRDQNPDLYKRYFPEIYN